VFQVLEQFPQSPWRRVICHPEAVLFETDNHEKLSANLA
jgi:hypothetical protein